MLTTSYHDACEKYQLYMVLLGHICMDSEFQKITEKHFAGLRKRPNGDTKVRRLQLVPSFFRKIDMRN